MFPKLLSLSLLAAQPHVAPVPAMPAAALPASTLRARAAELIPLLNGDAAPEALFSPTMLSSVPASQIRTIAAGLRARYGKALRLARLDAVGEASGLAVIACERGSISFRLVVDPQPGGKLTGLLLVAEEMANDGVPAVLAELRALPGQVSVAVAALEEAGPRPLGVNEPARPMAIGSAFKLFILAELVRSVRAGERKWSDVAPLDHRSLPSGILQDWPVGSPLTLHSLAALMISRSDNSATDTLLHVAGRERVEQMVAALGVKDAARNRPFLSTREAFAIKADRALTARWLAADETGRRALLPPLADANVDAAALAGPPRAISTVEWFASPDDLVRVMDWMRRNADKTALDILAINPGVGGDVAAGFDYLGYKGGSETGVIELTFLLRRKDGSWRAVAAGWNNPDAAVDETKFVGLIRRLVSLQK
jgi:hypothetical protein